MFHYLYLRHRSKSYQAKLGSVEAGIVSQESGLGLTLSIKGLQSGFTLSSQLRIEMNPIESGIG